MPDRIIQHRYLGFISLIVGFAVVHWLKPVLLPVILALFIIAVAWPITRFLNKHMPKRLSHFLSFIAIVGILASFATGIFLTLSQFSNHLPQYEPQFLELLKNVRYMLKSYGLPAPKELNSEQLQLFLSPLINTFYAVLGHVILIVSLVILGLPELVFWEEKLERCLGKSDGSKWRKAGVEAASSFQRYMTIMTAIGLLAALLTIIFCFATGLDFPLLWGLLAFIMNFVPILGAILAIIPPAILAIMQFSDPTHIWLVWGGLGVIQFFMGNVIDPKYQGKFLSMSPVIILISIAFWTLLWGAPGAFLAVPLTHIFMIAFAQFPNTKHIACLLSDGQGRCPK